MMHLGDEALALLALAAFWPGAIVEEFRRDADGYPTTGFRVLSPERRDGSRAILRPYHLWYTHPRESAALAIADAIESVRVTPGAATVPNDLLWGDRA